MANKENTEKKQETAVITIPYVEGQGTEKTFGVNGVFYKVKKGRPVEVPISVAKLWWQCQEQEMAAIEAQERMKMQSVNQDLG